MLRRATRTWVHPAFVALLFPVLLLGVAAPVQALRGCVATTVDRDGCCCRTAHEPAAPPKIERQCCCEVDAPSTPTAPIQASAGVAPAMDSAPIALAEVVSVPRAQRTRTETAPPLPPPGTGPPLILLKRSLLI